MAWFSRSGRIVRALIGAAEKDIKRRPARRAGSPAKLFLEPLEDRVVPAMVMWNSKTQGGDWDVGSNWVGGNVPGASDDAVIPAGLSTPVFHAQAVNDPVNSITSGSTLELRGGTLTVATTVAPPMNGGPLVLLLDGGTLSGATIADNTVVQLTPSGGTLAGVTIDTNATVDGTIANGAAPNVADVKGGLTLNGAVLLGAANGSSAGQLNFDNTQDLTGTGSIALGSS